MSINRVGGGPPPSFDVGTDDPSLSSPAPACPPPPDDSFSVDGVDDLKPFPSDAELRDWQGPVVPGVPIIDDEGPLVPGVPIIDDEGPVVPGVPIITDEIDVDDEMGTPDVDEETNDDSDTVSV